VSGTGPVSSAGDADQATGAGQAGGRGEGAAQALPLAVKLLHPQAQLPRRAHPGDAGADLFSVDEVTIPTGERREVGTGIALAIPDGYAGFVQPRSGLAFKHGIMVVNSPGLIDAGYRGEVRISLYNSGSEPFAITVGERIAQLVVQRVAEPEFLPVEELPPSVRGSGGFGSSGR
jgi:dUTP pyrophosphatase